ncbi:MAG: histidine phosphatase family protein [Microvirga sp.]|jgi:phosphohistidine phosphatase SixA
MKESSRARWQPSLACILCVLGFMEALVPAHADARRGAGDPIGFRLDDCTIQCNLSAEGRVDAQSVGRSLKTKGVAATKPLSSPWCRCADTARLLDLSAVEIEPAFATASVMV